MTLKSRNATAAIATIAALNSIALAQNPDRAYCSDSDARFASSFDTYVLIAVFVAGVLLPFVIPFLFRHKWWWLTESKRRWIFIAIPALTMVAIMLIGLPYMALKIPGARPYAFSAYPGVSPDYLDCTQQTFKSTGFAWGLLGAGGGSSLLNVSAMFFLFITTALTSFVLYLIISSVARKKFGLRAI